jgi:hypothetical protein
MSTWQQRQSELIHPSDINAMHFDLTLTPAGRLRCKESETGDTGKPDAWMRRVLNAFSSSQFSGLFALAASNPDEPLSPSLSFWRDFARRYLTHLCRTPESAENILDPIDSPEPMEIQAMLFSAPPMEGGEYMNTGLLQDLWIGLDGWVRKEISSSLLGLTGWLKKHAPLWHQVGRVCFHLAENKSNPEFPFAFLATYAPRLSRGGRVQYQPLGKALQEYAGQRNKKTLISLLSPVEAAAEKSPFFRKLVDSGAYFILWPGLQRTPIVSSGMSPSLRRAAFWCDFRTGGKSVPGLALLSPWATRSKAGWAWIPCWISRSSLPSARSG